MIKKYNPDFVLHLAALTDLEYCEKNENESWITNALGTENIARICKKYDITMVYISTAGVFDGKKDIYNDFDEPNPLNIYGKSKYYGEKIVQNILDKYFIFRAGWMMGGMHKDKKFISQILKQIKNGDDLNVVNDKMGNLTYTLDFSISTLKVIQTNKYGLYNQVCNGDGCSRYEIVKKMKEILKFENTINSVNSEFFKKDYFVNRPYSEKSKVKSL
jgi:dTDP-4-dehydrorhamnose reductase